MTENLINKQYGKLIVISSYIKNSHIICECSCECGGSKTVRLSDLKRGMVSSCGCLHKKDEIGKRCGDKIVIEEVGKTKSGDIKYLLRCIYCKKETTSVGSDLRRSKSSHNCSCKQKYVDQKLRKLIIKSVYKKNYSHFALCECDCGKEKEIRLQSVLSGKTKSCGCDSTTYSTKVGMKFGLLSVVEKAYTKKGVIYYYCDCDCGTKRKILSSSVLRAGGSTSCGCLRKKNWKRTGYQSNKTKNDLLEKYILRHTEISAKNRKISCELTIEDIKNNIYKPCWICGKTGKNKREIRKEIMYYNGLDRIDNDKGYLKNNILPCCGPCNMMRGKRTYEFMIDFLATVTYKNVKEYVQNR